MKLIEGFIPSGHPNRPGKKLEVLKAIVIHYTQNEEPGATDTMNVRYIGRKFVRNESGSFESDGKTPFRFGSAHVFCDMDSITLAIPTDEVAWGCGDKNSHGGYQPAAINVFGKRQNYQTVSVEICNNDAVKNSDEDWNGAVANAKQWVIDFLKNRSLGIDIEGSLKPQSIKPESGKPMFTGKILILRHYDITGKNCPAPFVKDLNAWEKFVKEIADSVA